MKYQWCKTWRKGKLKPLIGCQLLEGLVSFHMAKEGGTKTNGLKW